jgi:hypothetical protein
MYFVGSKMGRILKMMRRANGEILKDRNVSIPAPRKSLLFEIF